MNDLVTTSGGTIVPAEGPTFGTFLGILGQLEEQGKIRREGGPGLTISDDLSYEEWALLGLGFRGTRTALQFVIGDWIIWGEGKFGDRYEQAAELTGLRPQTLLNYAYVCRNVQRAHRRFPELLFSHHKEIAALEPREQCIWLDKAKAGRWSKDRLRDELRAASLLPPAPEQPAWGAAVRERAENLSKVTEEYVAAVREEVHPAKLREIAARAESVLRGGALPVLAGAAPKTLQCPSCGFEFDE